MIQRLLFGFGGNVAVQRLQLRSGEGGGSGGTADIKSHNPHLTGGELLSTG